MSKKLVMMTNNEIKGKSGSIDCLDNKSFFDRMKHKNELEIIVSQFLID